MKGTKIPIALLDLDELVKAISPALMAEMERRQKDDPFFGIGKTMKRSKVAEVLNVKPNTVTSWKADGRLVPSGYIGNRPRYSTADVKKLYNQKISKK